MMITTDWVHFTEGHRRLAFRATYGFDTDFAKKNNQEPYFSITGEGKPAHWLSNPDSDVEFCGCCHDEIIKFIPRLKPLIRWHLCGMKKGPMHYIENALYHAGFYYEQLKDNYIYRGVQNIDHLKSTIVYGAVDGDEEALEEQLKTPNPIEFKAWLEERFDALMSAFESDIKRYAAGLWTGTEKEMNKTYSRRI